MGSFTYVGKESRAISQIFEENNVKAALRTTNVITII
jgi:hypothetical protein